MSFDETALDHGRGPRGGAFDHPITTRLKLRHLHLLVALDDHRKLNRAATELRLSQPAASKMLAEIEKIVGVSLFDRLPRGIEPTWYGEALIRRTRTVLSELGQAGEEIAALRSGTGGSASIGAVMAPAVEMLTAAVTAARARLKGLQVTIDVETSDVLVGRLLASKLDFVISRIPAGFDPEPFDYEEIGAETLCMMVRRDHPLAELASVRPSDLADREWLMQPRGSLIRRSVETMLLRHGLPAPSRVVASASILMTLVMTGRTDAIAPLPVPVAEIFLKTGDYRTLTLAEPIAIAPYGLLRVKGRPLSPAARILFDLVREQITGPA
ncbi:LysR family transcriptional regulator [Siculibacillus lacustris]|uniref:LysR family transcriptional regulator n=1 Tax=Siculibacillus lacustris TaxID=1549641 RepID=A0A4Q9VS08_9HYPH|nr:LysR family transcriptional regulator [Siculibacillus lacustris]TBW38741.1 LysR family transcriptional regulator [Siculibacillus lacustris]